MSYEVGVFEIHFFYKTLNDIRVILDSHFCIYQRGFSESWKIKGVIKSIIFVQYLKYILK